MDETHHRWVRVDYCLDPDGTARLLWDAATAHSDLCMASIHRLGVCRQRARRSVSVCFYCPGVAGSETQLGHNNRGGPWVRDVGQTISDSSVSRVVQTLGMEDAGCSGLDDPCRLPTVCWSRSPPSAWVYSDLCSGARHCQWRTVF